MEEQQKNGGARAGSEGPRIKIHESWQGEIHRQLETEERLKAASGEQAVVENNLYKRLFDHDEVVYQRG